MNANDHWVDSADELFSFIKYVLLYAPNRFPYRDFLTEQLNLESAFVELRRGLSYLKAHVPLDVAENLLERSLAAYRSGDEVLGGRLLNEFDQFVFAREWKGIEKNERPLVQGNDGDP